MYTSAFIVVVADKSDTEVNIKIPGKQVQVYTLKRLDTLTLKDDVPDYTGTVVTSSKSVSVFAGHDCAYVPVNDKRLFKDMLMTQILPMSELGFHHVIPPFRIGYSFNTYYYYRVVASEDETNVKTDRTGKVVF